MRVPALQLNRAGYLENIFLENIEIVPLYLAKKRPMLERDGMLMMVDDDRIGLQSSEVIAQRMVRFRTLGCWPPTGAVASSTQTMPDIIEEMLVSTTSERQGRVIGSQSIRVDGNEKASWLFLRTHRHEQCHSPTNRRARRGRNVSARPAA